MRLHQNELALQGNRPLAEHLVARGGNKPVPATKEAEPERRREPDGVLAEFLAGLRRSEARGFIISKCTELIDTINGNLCARKRVSMKNEE